MKNASLPVSIFKIKVKMSTNVNFFFSRLRDFFMDNINNEFPTATVITGDFNDRCAKWCNKDINNSVGRQNDSVTHH